MVKFCRGNVVVLGLSEENIKRIQQDKPIKFNMKELGFDDITVFIMAGETEHTIAKQISEAAGSTPENTVYIDLQADKN